MSLIALLSIVGGCTEDSPELPTPLNEQLLLDIEAIDQYLLTNNIEAQIDSTGLRYVIGDLGDSLFPNLEDSILINYEARILAEANLIGIEDSVTYALNATILGWRYGMPKIMQGGKITLYVPSVYAYGVKGLQANPDTGFQGVPPNANLIFEVDLLETIKP